MTATYEKIAVANGTGSSGTITFTSIPNTYTDLVLVTNALSVSGTYNAGVRFNSDTGTNYSRTAFTWDGGSVLATRATNQDNITSTVDGIVSNTVAAHILYIMSYANTSVWKTMMVRNSNSSYGVDTLVGLWRSTSAISTIDYIINGSFTTSSVFTLYGIKAK